MTNKHMKRFSSLGPRGIQIKTIMRYNFTPTRIDITEKTDNILYCLIYYIV